MTNKQLIDYLRSLPDNYGYGSTEHVAIGNISDRRQEHMEFWNILKPRLFDFLYIRSSLHEKYKGTPTFPYRGYTSELMYAVVNKRKSAIEMWVTVKVDDTNMGRCWCYNEKIRMPDFYDIPGFIKREGSKLRNARLGKAKEELEKYKKKVMRLEKEISRLEKEEGKL